MSITRRKGALEANLINKRSQHQSLYYGVKNAQIDRGLKSMCEFLPYRLGISQRLVELEDMMRGE